MLVRGPFTLEKAESVCQWYYRIGFLGLPWLWGLLYILFSHYQHESERIRWYVTRAKLLSLVGAAVFVLFSLALIGLLPSTSSLWVIAPFQDTFQWGIFAANMSASDADNSSSSSGSSSSGSAGGSHG